MGNDMGATCAISVDQDPYYSCSDETIPARLTGKVYTRVTKENVYCKSLSLRFKAVEQSCYGQSNGHGETSFVYDTRVIFDITSKLDTFQSDHVRRGDYQYPFVFNIPLNLQSSMYSKENALVQYTLEATVDRPGFTTKSYTVRKNVDVRLASKKYATTPVIVHPYTHSIRTFWCCSKKMTGEITVGITADKSVMTRADPEPVAFTIYLQNKSPFTILSVEIKIIERITTTVKTRTDVANNVVNRLALPGDTVNGSQMILPQHRANSNELPSTTVLMPPSIFREDANGRLVKVSHVFQAVVNTSPKSYHDVIEGHFQVTGIFISEESPHVPPTPPPPPFVTERWNLFVKFPLVVTVVALP
jgi:Arrestin (or S-antigen), N-terminal domain